MVLDGDMELVFDDERVSAAAILHRDRPGRHRLRPPATTPTARYLLVGAPAGIEVFFGTAASRHPLST